MAEGKKAFIVYTNWKNYTDIMTNEQAGQWIKWCLDYCNDLEPKYPEDATAKMLCVMCKDILKADLKKYEEKRERFKKIGKQFNNDIEKEIVNDTENGNQERESKTDSVISNKLIVNSNKLIVDDNSSNNIEGEELQIEIIKSFMQQLEELFNGKISPKNRDIAIKMCETYGSKTALNEIKRNIDKTNPINYANTILQNQNIDKKIVRKSKWLDENFGKEE